MKLLTKEIEKNLPKIKATEGVPLAEKVAVFKLFDPCGRYTFFVVEGERDEENGDMELWGYCVSPLGPDCDEWGYASLNELSQVRNRFGLGIERDLHFHPTKVSELIKEH